MGQNRFPTWLCAALIATLCALGFTARAHAYGIDAKRPLSQLRLDTWSVRDGLPSRVITSIAQTPDGFIWLGTAAGLIRFDGVTFDTYDTQNTPSLPSNLITALTVTRSGTLWVGTEWGGFGRFINGRFFPCGVPDKHWSQIRTIVEAPDGSIWAGGWSDFPVQHVMGGKIITYSKLQTTDPGVNVLMPVGNDKVICGMPWDTPRVLNADGSISKIWPQIKFGYPCNDICHARDGSYWYGVGHNGLFQIKGSTVRHFTVQDGLASNDVTKVFQDCNGQIWVGTTNGVSVWNGAGFQSFGKDDGLYDSAVGSIAQDKEGNLWIGSGVGLNRFAQTKLRPFTLSVGSDTATIGTNNSLSPASNGGVWCATNMGLWRLRDESMTRCSFADKLGSHFEGVAAGPDGRLWLWMDNGNQTYSLWCVTPRNGNLDSLVGNVAPGSYDVQKVTVPGAAFCGVPQAGKLIVIGRTKIYTIVPGKIASTATFPGSIEFMACQDPTGAIWVGDENGLIRWKNGQATILDAGIPKDTHVLGVDASDPKCVWITTDHGLGRFQNGRTLMFGKAAGLPDTNLFQIVRDRSGRIWIGSNFGIFSIRVSDIDNYSRHLLRTIPCKPYLASDGIKSFPTCFGACRSVGGKIWFVGDKGITVVDPKSTSLNPIPPPVSIESARVDQVMLTQAGRNKVPPGQGLFSVRYAALSFAAPEKVQFRYKLEGLDDRWTDAGNRRVAMYPYLPPGHYRFVVIACNNDGVWNRTGASISFIVMPHSYQTTWFKIVCAAALLLLLIVVYSLRVRNMVLRNRELEEKVAERTAQLQVSNEQLQAAQEALAKQYNLLEDRNHELEAMQAELETHNEELRRTQESLAQANAHLEALATTDGLTGLKNHRSFQERLEYEWERHRRYQGEISLILLDIDRFKQYNDTYGHQAGDDVLKTVADVLAREARESDLVARYGGEEFVIILPETDRAGAVNLADRIRQAIEETSWPLRAVTASFGVATADESVKNGSDFFTAADAALFYSKRHGRNYVAHAADLPKKPVRKAS